MSIKISNLPAAVSVNDADLIPIVQGGTTKKATANLVKVTLGTTAGTACEGNDVRLSDSRIPTGVAGGDLIGSYPNPALTTTGVAALTYGSATHVGVFSVNDKGRITGATSQAIAIAASQVASGITSAQISGLSASQVSPGLTSAQISGIGVSQISPLGANVDAFLSTPSSANLAAALTDETGTGAAVFGTSPTLATPTINGYTEGTVPVTVAASTTLSIDLGTVLTGTLLSGTATTFTMPAVAAGKSFVLYLKQPSSGTVGTATFTSVAWAGGSVPAVTATLGRLDIFSFVSDGAKWYGNVSKNYTY